MTDEQLEIMKQHVITHDNKEQLWLIKQAEQVKRFEEMIEGNDGMSVKEIKIQFIDLHRDLLKLERQNKRYREAINEAVQACDCCAVTAKAILEKALEEST